MELSLSELASFVGGRLDAGADDRPIRGAAAIAEALEDDVTFFGNAKYLPALKACRAGAVLVPEDFGEAVTPAVIRVENPSAAFTRVVERFAPPPVRRFPGVHPSAIVGEGVQFGVDVSIGPCVVIEDGVTIGAGSTIGAHGFLGQESRVGDSCLLHARVTLGARCLLGNRVIVQSGAVIGSDGFGYEFTGGQHVKVPQIGIVQVDDDVEIGANATIDRARFGRTWLQQGTKIDNLVQVAHNVVVGRHCILVAQVGISGSARLGNYVTLAGQVGVVGHIEIGDQVIVGAQSGVSKSLSPGEAYMGSPAVPAKDFREDVAQVRRLGRLVARVKRLEQPGA